MNHKIELEELNKEAMKKLEAYMLEKGKSENIAHVDIAKNEWQLAWNKLMETMLVLERLEI